MEKLILILLTITCLLAGCTSAFLKPASKEAMGKDFISNYIFFYKGTLENPGMVIADKDGGIKGKFKQLKQATPEEIIKLLERTDNFDLHELMVKTGRIVSSEGYILTPQDPEKNFEYDFSVNKKEGYFTIIEKILPLKPEAAAEMRATEKVE